MDQHSAAVGRIKTGKKPPKKITPDYLHNAGLAYLGRFASSAGNFRAVMKRRIDRSCRFHTEQDPQACLQMLDELVQKFIRAGLLNDEDYTRAVVRSLRRRGQSTKAIHMKLATRKVGAELTAEALREHGENDLSAALRLARRRKIGPFAGEKTVDPAKALAAMGRAGFDFGTAQRALAMTEEEALAILETSD